MAKSKVSQTDTLKQESVEFMNHVQKEVKKLEDCDFETFKANMIAVIEQMYQAILMIFESNVNDRKKLVELVVDRAEIIRDVNDDNFRKAERNFKHVEKALDEFEHRVGKAEAGAICSLMRSSAVLVRMFKGGFISYDEAMNPEQEFKVVPKGLKKCIADVFGISQKSMKTMIQKVSEAA